ncbi:hypothetical protein BJX70DRAFT_400373 [Aspergillus crustosus]
MHPQIIRSLALLGGFTLAAANDVVSLILPQVDDQALVGEVVGVDGSTTTYIISCPTGADSDECGIPPDGLTVTAASTAFIYDYRYEDYWLHQSCEHRGTTWFSCAITNTQSDFSTTTRVTESIEVPYIPVTITATETGADSTPTETSSSSSDEDATSSSVSNSPSVTSTPSETASPTSEEAEPEETNSDNAAVALPTGSATQWLVSGAGMAIALALA